MNVALYHQKLAKALNRAGGLYTLSDILDRLKDGRMQSFSQKNSFVVTQISNFPRARAVEIILLVGDLADSESLHKQVMEFAKAMDANVVIAQGRYGWMALAAKNGWRIMSRNMVFRKEVA